MSIDYSKHGLRKRGSDKNLVEEAERHLRELLSNPYYAEAFQRLRRGKDAVVLDRRGVLPAKGKLAASLQSASSPKRSPGRPSVERPGFDKMLKAIETHPDQESLAEYCRRIAHHFLPRSTGLVRKTFTKRLEQLLRNHKKKVVR